MNNGITLHIKATCPLCGRPQTHLSSCKGCGDDAWGREIEMAFGEDAIDRSRECLRGFLAKAEDITQAQIDHAIKHAYQSGGCLICAECWDNVAAQPDAQLTCPLVLVSERALRGHLPRSLTLALLDWKMQEEILPKMGKWCWGIWKRWTQVWNTVPAGPEREAVSKWRAALLEAVIPGVENQETN